MADLEDRFSGQPLEDDTGAERDTSEAARRARWGHRWPTLWSSPRTPSPDVPFPASGPASSAGASKDRRNWSRSIWAPSLMLSWAANMQVVASEASSQDSRWLGSPCT